MRNFLFLLIGIFISNIVYASPWGTSCEYATQDVIISLPSGIKISIDPNAPVGTVFFEYLVNSQSGSAYKCTSPTSFTTQQGFLYDSGGSTTTLTGYGLNGSYPVYKTNVAGLGIVVRYSATAFPYWLSTIATYTNTTVNYTSFTSRLFDIDLIKYGEIPAGAKEITINSTYIPDVLHVLKIDGSSDTGKNPNGTFVLKRFKFSPVTINILTATCDTPDVSVNLGLRKLSDTINREGVKFATPWTDASVRLTNCPVFYGTGQRELKDTTRDNVMTVTLMPGNATTSNQGIMPIDNVSYAATGVGIQLAYGTSASPQLVDFSAGKGTKTYTMSSTQGPVYTIPLVARYIQTAGAIDDIMPGKANGKITYLVNYY